MPPLPTSSPIPLSQTYLNLNVYFPSISTWSTAGSEVLTAVTITSPIFWDTTPCSSAKLNRRFGEIYRIHLQDWKVFQSRNEHEAEATTRFILVFCLGYSSALKIKAVFSLGMPVNIHRTTRRYMPQNNTTEEELFRSLNVTSKFEWQNCAM
jgi:hypothetical protein